MSIAQFLGKRCIRWSVETQDAQLAEDIVCAVDVMEEIKRWERDVKIQSKRNERGKFERQFVADRNFKEIQS